MTDQKSLEYCIKHGLNPNPNPPGEIKPLGNSQQIRKAAHRAAQNILKVFKKNNEYNQHSI